MATLLAHFIIISSSAIYNITLLNYGNYLSATIIFSYGTTASLACFSEGD